MEKYSVYGRDMGGTKDNIKISLVETQYKNGKPAYIFKAEFMGMVINMWEYQYQTSVDRFLKYHLKKSRITIQRHYYEQFLAHAKKVIESNKIT